MNISTNKVYTNTYNTVLWLISFAGVIVKILIDSIFLISGKTGSTGFVILRLILSVVIVIPPVIFFFRDFQNFGNQKDENKYENFINELIKILFFGLTLILFSVFLPKSNIIGSNPESIFLILIVNLFAYAFLINAFLLLRFIAKWLWIFRFKNTKKYFGLLGFLIVLICFAESPDHFHHLSADEVLQNKLLVAFTVIVNILLYSITFLTAKKNTWLVLLPKSQKWKIILISLFGIGLAITITIIDLNESRNIRFYNSLLQIYPLNSLLVTSYCMLLIYLIRIFFAIIVSMPTSDLVERRSNELSSITFLNKLVAETKEFDKIIDTVTKLALYSSNGSAAWTDIYEKDGLQIIKACENMNKQHFDCDEIREEIINKIYSDIEFIDYIGTLKEPVYIESLSERKLNSFRKIENLFLANSMIIMPLQTSTEKIGNLFIVHNEEYGFESDYLTILSAYNDNINIALENARLLTDSIEKEKYKQELMIARNIESKLIPQVFPKIENFDIAAFSLTANEVGGDFYDVLNLKDGKKCFILGDVSGKGMSAAFYMVLLKGVILAISQDVCSGAELLKRINSSLFGSMERQMYITMSVIVIENEKGKVSLSRAGHLPFLHKTKNNINTYTPNGIGIGLAKSEVFDKNIEEITIDVRNDDLILMFSDGITELKQNNSEIGIEFLKQFMENQISPVNSQTLVDDLKNELGKFSNINESKDDMTLLSLVYKS